jgi:PAS domain S-box-containing protein
MARCRPGRLPRGRRVARRPLRPVTAPRRILPFGFRGRLVAYVLLAALLPVATGVVAFGRWAAAGERDAVDAHLHRVLQAGRATFAEEVREAETRATEVANRPGVQRALARGDRAALERIAAEAPNTAFLDRRGSLVAGRIDERSVQRSVSVMARGRPLGEVAIGVPLDDRLLTGLSNRIRLPADDALALVRDGQVLAGPSAGAGGLGLVPARPSDVRLGGSEQRALSAPLVDRGGDGDGAVMLVALRSRDAVGDAVADVWQDAALAGLAMLAALAVVAAAAAPAVARSRLTLEERVNAARALAHVADGIFLVDRAEIIRSWNPAAEAITGLAADDVRDRRAAEAIPGWAEVSRAIPVAPAGGQVRPGTLPFKFGGREVWLSMSGVDFSDGTVYAFRDMTDERHVEELKSHFIATVSHELRTPLAAVYGSAMTLARGAEIGEEQRGRLLSVIAEQADRLAWIVEDVLLASELAAGTLRMANEKFDAREMARTVVASARTHLPENVRLELESPESLPPVSGDYDKARQVLANLVDNAVKYSPRGGRVEVRLEARDGRVRFTVRDEGIGIPPAESDRIFEKFHRLDPNQTTGVGGAGLGLYICRELVRRMSGRIWVASTPGRGSTFSFELPAAVPVQTASRERVTASG